MRGHRHIRTGVLLAAIVVLLLSGCARQEPEPMEPTASPAPVTMPDLVGKTLDEARAALADTQTPVEVTFPAVVATATIEATYVAGAWVPAREKRLELPARTTPLDGGPHPVSGQMPAAGALLSSVETVTLVAGAHPNPTDQPWVLGHAGEVTTKGATECFDCHNPDSCADCHTAFNE